MRPQRGIEVKRYWSDEDGCWIADASDFRPCSAHGDTSEEAVAHVQDAIDGWPAVARNRSFAIPDARFRPAIYASVVA